MTRRAGFTLLELILGAAIAAVLLAALYAVLSGVLGLKRHATAALERSLPELGVAEILRRDLNGMVVPAGVLSDSITGVEETEDGQRRDTLSFCTTTGVVGDRKPWPAVQKVEYYLDTTDGVYEYNTLHLMRAVTRNLLETNSGDTREVQSLLPDVDSLAFSYYDGETWQTSWDSTTTESVAPQAVHVRIGLTPSGDSDLVNTPIEVECEVAAVSGESSASTSDSTSGGGGAAG